MTTGKTVLRRGMLIEFDDGRNAARATLVEKATHGLWRVKLETPRPYAPHDATVSVWPARVWRATKDAWVDIEDDDSASGLKERALAALSILDENRDLLKQPSPVWSYTGDRRITMRQHAIALIRWRDAPAKITGCEMVESAARNAVQAYVEDRQPIPAAMTAAEWRAARERLESMGLTIKGLMVALDFKSTRTLARMSIPEGHKNHRPVTQPVVDGYRDLLGQLAQLDNDARAELIKRLNKEGLETDKRDDWRHRDRHVAQA